MRKNFFTFKNSKLFKLKWVSKLLWASLHPITFIFRNTWVLHFGTEDAFICPQKFKSIMYMYKHLLWTHIISTLYPFDESWCIGFYWKLDMFNYPSKLCLLLFLVRSIKCLMVSWLPSYRWTFSVKMQFNPDIKINYKLK